MGELDDTERGKFEEAVADAKEWADDVDMDDLLGTHDIYELDDAGVDPLQQAAIFFDRTWRVLHDRERDRELDRQRDRSDGIVNDRLREIAALIEK